MSKKLNQEPMNLEPKSQEPKGREPKGQEPKSHELKLEEPKKPQNLRANAMPVDGYVLAVDGKLKTRFETMDDAAAAGAKLKQSFPVIQVMIYDATARAYTPVDLQEQK